MLAELVLKANKWIEAFKEELMIDLDGLERQAQVVWIISPKSACVEMLLGKIFDEIGSNKMASPAFQTSGFRWYRVPF